MAQNGMFRTAMGGFNKQDVLQYIDEITAAWDAERQELVQQAESAASAEQQASAAAQAAEQRAAAAEQNAANATQALEAAQAQLAEVQQSLDTVKSELSASRAEAQNLATQLEDALRHISRLEEEISAVSNQRDDAIAAVADAREQLIAQEDMEAQLAESRQRIQKQDEQIAAMQQAITRYEQVLGNAETAHERVDGIVRPFIEQANRQADETLDSVQAVLAGVLAQLGELQGSVEQRRQALQRCKKDSDSRLSAAFGDWLGQAQGAGTPTDGHFF